MLRLYSLHVRRDGPVRLEPTRRPIPNQHLSSPPGQHARLCLFSKQEIGQSVLLRTLIGYFSPGLCLDIAQKKDASIAVPQAFERGVVIEDRRGIGKLRSIPDIVATAVQHSILPG